MACHNGKEPKMSDTKKRECWKCRIVDEMGIEASYEYTTESDVIAYVCSEHAQEALLAGYRTQRIEEPDAEKFEQVANEMDRCHVVIGGIREFDKKQAAKVLREHFGEDRTKLAEVEAELKRANGVLEDLHRGG